MMRGPDSVVAIRQDPLRDAYAHRPDEAWITDRARAYVAGDEDPFHGTAEAGGRHGVSWTYGIHPAIGGAADAPNPGDILCTAQATCLLATLRMLADRYGLPLADVEVEVTADVDVRGTLMVDVEVPVGFQSMTCKVRGTAPAGVEPRHLRKLEAAAERCCVVMQTLRGGGVDVAVEWELGTGARPGAPRPELAGRGAKTGRDGDGTRS